MQELELTCFRGRVGLAGILRALNLKGNDEVITQAFTCVAVPEGIIAGGGIPIFADLQEGSVNVDPLQVERKISARTKAIVVQHTFGYAGPIREVLEIARTRNIAVIEDCCHTFRTKVEGREVGSFGDAAFFSLEWGKPLPCGVGGLVRADNPTIRVALEDWHRGLRKPGLARRLRLELQYLAFTMLYRPNTYWPVKKLFNILSRTGAAEGNFNDFDFSSVSEDFQLSMSDGVRRRFNSRKNSLSNVSANSKRVVKEYRELSIKDTLSRVSDDRFDNSVLARYPLWSSSKEEILDAAKSANVELADWYRTPIHPLIESQQHAVNYVPGDCPVAERACTRIVSLPTNKGVSPSYLAKVRSLLSKPEELL